MINIGGRTSFLNNLAYDVGGKYCLEMRDTNATLFTTEGHYKHEHVGRNYNQMKCCDPIEFCQHTSRQRHRQHKHKIYGCHELLRTCVVAVRYPVRSCARSSPAFMRVSVEDAYIWLDVAGSSSVPC